VSKLISPWSSPEAGEAWDRITIGGVLFTGKVDVDGTPWKKKRDKRHSRGHNGARSVGAGWDLGEWTITLMAFDDTTDAQLANVIDVVVGDSPTAQDAQALTIDHPALAVKGVNQVVFKEGDAPTPNGPGGLLVWKIKVEEFRLPDPRPVTRTPAPAPQKAHRPTSVYKTQAGPPSPGPEMRPVPPPAPSADP